MQDLTYVDYDAFIDRNILRIVTNLDDIVSHIPAEDMQTLQDLINTIPTLRTTLKLEYKDFHLADISNEDNTALVDALKDSHTKLANLRYPIVSRMIVQLCLDIITGDIAND